MSGIDAALAVLLLLCALRGFWRGFLRECFGFAGLALGLVVAMRARVTKKIPRRLEERVQSIRFTTRIRTAAGTLRVNERVQIGKRRTFALQQLNVGW